MESTAVILCQKGGSDLAISILGCPEEKDNTNFVNGIAAVTGYGMEYFFQWQTGGEPYALGLRTATIGLNTLRMALRKMKNEETKHF